MNFQGDSQAQIRPQPWLRPWLQSGEHKVENPGKRAGTPDTQKLSFETIKFMVIGYTEKEN